MMNARELLDMYKDKTCPKSVYNDNLQNVYDALEENGLLEKRIFEGNRTLAKFLFEVLCCLQFSEKNYGKKSFRLKDPRKFIEWATSFAKEEYLSRINKGQEWEDALVVATAETIKKLYNTLHNKNND